MLQIGLCRANSPLTLFVLDPHHQVGIKVELENVKKQVGKQELTSTWTFYTNTEQLWGREEFPHLLQDILKWNDTRDAFFRSSI